MGRPKLEDSELRRNLSKRWYMMIDRCQNQDHPRYPQYGGSGVIVSDEWKDKETFIKDVKDLPGFSRDGILNGSLHLDKDSKVQGNKIYSKDTCVFIEQSENNKHKPNQMREFVATSPDGTTKKSNNQSEIAREVGVAQSSVSACLNDKRDSVRGWKFKFTE